MKLRLSLACSLIIIISACTTKIVEIENIKKDSLKASITLEQIFQKKFLLDDETAPKPRHTQLYRDTHGTRYFTFLNTYSNSIYFYNYDSLNFKRKISFDKKGPNGLLMPVGYFIKSLDSIYIYEKRNMEVIIANDKAQILNKIGLLGNTDKSDARWTLTFPQYAPTTVTSFIETPKELLLTGQYMFSIPDTIIYKFKFTMHLDKKSNNINYSHIYPRTLYGSNFNWSNNMLTEVFTDLHADGNKLIYSFPVSHDLYISDLDDSSGYSKIYGGSNFASTINSINKPIRKTSRQILTSHFLKNDEYASIIYDKYRKVYYRFLRKGIPDATIRTNLNEKEIAIIIMDENFNYLGETTIGTRKNWYWRNSFVTKEGLNIEYLEDHNLDEMSMIIKIFIIKKI